MNLVFIKDVKALKWFGDVVMLKEYARFPGVFGQNGVNRFEDIQGAESNIPEVANWGGNNVE